MALVGLSVWLGGAGGREEVRGGGEEVEGGREEERVRRGWERKRVSKTAVDGSEYWMDDLDWSGTTVRYRTVSAVSVSGSSPMLHEMGGEAESN